jgi:TRAP-type C4-dicarboxylate transport system substrate-binding protein
MEQYKFYEVLDHIIKPALHTPGVVEVIINTKAFKGLKPEQQDALRQAAKIAMDKSFAAGEELDRQALENSSKHGVKVISVSEVEMKRFRAACAPLWESEAKKSPVSARLVQILKDHLKSKGIDH